MSDLIDLLKINFAGARLNPEKSHAYPQNFYGDPAKVVKLQSETNCNTCLYSRTGKAGLFCSKGRDYGKRCEFYRITKK
jgi:hypothetical protein